jgi:alkylation response protein AidB-like acyl-CoA dehydrogenase
MPIYRAPLEDIRFLFHEVLDIGHLTSLPGYADATGDLVDSVLAEGARFCEQVLQPLNASADLEGCTFQHGKVTTPRGFKEAYQALVDGGWPALAAHPEHGGQGLPVTVRVALDEMLLASNLAFSMFPQLLGGAYETLERHGSDALKSAYLPKIASGEWTATMCLTEAHAGTDLGMIRTTATPRADGAFSVNGSKTFISGGEHDLTPNIVHLVLARLPDAPPGTKGISLFLVPKFLPGPDGALGARNGVACGAIEHKMGIKGSPTCVMNFDDAVGYLVGEPHRGMRAMFTMMNGARLGVGLQGLGLADASYQNAVAYARDRVQGRSLSGPKHPGAPADPILVHADIRRGLLTMRAFTEAARALALWTGMQIDRELRHPDATTREEAADFVALLTPVIKALFTDLGFEAANIGVQTLGGYGYVREYGLEQFVRDARIGQIYEGTNYVQAIDLLGRKLREGDGRLFRRLAALIESELARAGANPALADIVGPVAQSTERLQRIAASLDARARSNADEAGAAASEFLRLFGLVTLGWMWVRMADVAASRQQQGGQHAPAFYAAKLKVARFYVSRILPVTRALEEAIASGGAPILAMSPDEF